MMSASATDPYAVLGLTPQVSDAELRRVYRALVKRHHPDHNGGSPESTARFAQIQDAYARVARARRASGPPPAAAEDPGIEKRIADMERELARARAAQPNARPSQPIRQPGPSRAYGQAGRPTPHQLGYYETDDSITRIIDDAAAGLGDRLKDARHSELSRRLTDLFGGTHEEK
jgi:hypothetical protein